MLASRNNIFSYITIERAEKELESTTVFVPLEDDKENVTEEPFSCPVCYTDGSESGLVKPASCSHNICLKCYTSIVIRVPHSLCPMCRTEYLPTLEQPEEVVNIEIRAAALDNIHSQIVEQLAVIHRIIDSMESEEAIQIINELR